MRLALAFATFTVLAVLAQATVAAPTSPTLGGGTLVEAGRQWSYGGKIPVPLLAQNVTLHVDGTQVDWDLTDATGTYTTRAYIHRGDHVLIARWLGGESDPLHVRGYPTLPAQPNAPRVEPGFYWWQTNVSWIYPWTDGGYPVTSYTLERSVNGSAFSTLMTANVTSYVDAGTPGESYEYRGRTTTDFGTSSPVVWPYVANRTIATIDVVDFHLCDGANCTDVPRDGSRNVTAGANVTVNVRVRGEADDHPVATPYRAGVTVLGSAKLGESARVFDVATNATGEYAMDLGGLYVDAPTSGCRWILVTAHARTVNQGRSEDTASFELCAL